MQLERLSLGDHGVAGVIAPVEARYQMGLFGYSIDHPSFAFISPLSPDYNYRWHAHSFLTK
jgi:hypothetical protein